MKKTSVRSKKFQSLKWASTWQLSVLALPAVIWFIVFCYIPMMGCVIAFKDYNSGKGIFGSKWCGLKNFEYLFGSNDAARILRNTICYNLAFIVLGILLGLVFALLLDQVKKPRFVKLYQTMLFLPYFISWVAAAFIAQGLFQYHNGVLNNVLTALGAEPIQWYVYSKPWPFILTLAHIWKSIGFNILLYYGAILGIDVTLYEAAEIDGANRWQRIINITIPMLKPTIIVLFIMNIGRIMRADFGLFYYVPNHSGSLYNVIDVLDTYIYRTLKVSGDISGSSAAAFFQSVVGLILVLITNGIVRKLDPDNSMF